MKSVQLLEVNNEGEILREGSSSSNNNIIMLLTNFGLYFILAPDPAACAGRPSQAPSAPSPTCPWSRHSIALPICNNAEHQEIPARDDDSSDEVSPSLPDWVGGSQCIEQFCLYSSQRFQGGRGIAVISTAANVEILKALETAQHVSSEKSPPYVITEVANKGLGMIANQTLRRGDSILSKTPAILIHRDFLELFPPGDQYPILDAAIQQLPDLLRQTFLSQMGHFGGHRVSDILATNSFQMDLGGEHGQHYGNFPEVSRFNHDCRANVAFHIDQNLNHVTTVVRDVSDGEELTISYLDPFEPRALRQERAQFAWGFACSCSQCSLPDHRSAKSDDRLRRIADIRSKLSDQKAPVTQGMIQNALNLYKEERLESKIAGIYTLAALNYNMLGNDKQATKHAKLAIEALSIEYGPGSPDEDSMKILAQKPKEHFTWRLRM